MDGLHAYGDEEKMENGHEIRSWPKGGPSRPGRLGL